MNPTRSTTGCPDRESLGRFVAGNLPRPQFLRVAKHVERCAARESALAEFDAPTDSVLNGLRSLTASAVSSAPIVSAELLDAARSAYEHRPTSSEPRFIGKFELLEQLGAGSFGQVFRARDTELGRIVAIKMLRAGRLASAEEIERFEREARSAALLQHPGLVALHESGLTDDGQVYLVEEFVPGETLAERLKSGPMPWQAAAELVAGVAEALDYAHRQGIIHRDIKPSNILLGEDDRPHVMDFGLAKRDADESSMTVDGQLLGTPAYVSPEQARGEARQVDGRTDVYSLGVVLYEALTGERPFHGNRQMLMLQVLHDEPRPPRRLNDKVPRELETICLKAMAKTPSRRYATAGELADDLHRFLRGEPIRARPLGRVGRLVRWCRRNPVAVGLLAAVSFSSAFGLIELSRLSEHLVRSSALESAAQQSELLDVVNTLYSDDVVERAKLKGVEATHDYAKKRGAIPLPATLTIDLGRHLSERNQSGVQVRLYSDTPFRPRTDGGPKDAFEQEALAALRGDPTKPFYRFEEFQGAPALRYATAQKMQQTCVQCHNSHQDSTRKDWKEGEVAGVLEIIRPLEKDVVRTRQGLRWTFILMAAISASLLGLSFVVLIVGQRRREISSKS